jgi:uncharacterized protein YjbI with pentapeptide repeats
VAPADAGILAPPDLPALEPTSLAGTGPVQLSGALVEQEDGDPVRASRISITESELRGVTLTAEHAPGLALRDVILRDCGLSNIDGREGEIARVEIHHSQLVGFGCSRGRVRDLRVLHSSLQLASFAGARLQRVVFEGVQLSEASFEGARLQAVTFIDCRLAGADFRGATLKGCAIRGSSLDDIVGIASLRGVRMPWPDVLGSAVAMAAALGIEIEIETS